MAILTSKKFWITVIGLISLTCIEIFTNKLPLDLFCSLFAALVGVYTLSQGIADHGKEQAKVEEGRVEEERVES